MSKDEQGYNGWTNYETWNVHLWLSNDEYMYRECQRGVNRAGSVYDAAKWLKSYLEDLVDEILPDASMLKDLLGHALDGVNWREIAVDAFDASDEDEDEDDEEQDEDDE